MAFLIRIPDARKCTNSQFRIKNSLIGSRLIRINIKMDPEKLFSRLIQLIFFRKLYSPIQKFTVFTLKN